MAECGKRCVWHRRGFVPFGINRIDYVSPQCDHPNCWLVWPWEPVSVICDYSGNVVKERISRRRKWAGDRSACPMFKKRKWYQ
jgi:hypothetical protein